MTMDFLGRRLVSSTAKASRTPEPSWTYLPLGDSVRDGIEVWMQFKITSEIFLPTKSIARFSKYNKLWCQESDVKNFKVLIECREASAGGL